MEANKMKKEKKELDFLDRCYLSWKSFRQFLVSVQLQVLTKMETTIFLWHVLSFLEARCSVTMMSLESQSYTRN